MENNIIPTIQTETPSDESIHALQEELDQWIIDILENREVSFWWIY